ncbi:Hypothetical protein A7982_00254 [Minicystis rosea]|nr:Hypothetical protein A7982_00254 [Minicystis rosea]
MQRRAWTATALAGAIMATTQHAGAAGAWISNTQHEPVEQRIAIAAGPARTTLWTSLRYQHGGGTLAVVVPVPSGASIDLSSDAWLEALDVATAPRIFPPANVASSCPGYTGIPSSFQVEGHLGHTASQPLANVAVLDDAAAVSAWAAQAGLLVKPALQAKLASLAGLRFLAARFTTPPGAGVTPTLRVVMPAAPPVLPLALTHAGAADLPVTAWIIGAGRADLPNAAEVTVDALTWNAATHVSDYVAKRDGALASDATRFLVESTGHGALGQTLPIGLNTIDAVLPTYFARAAIYGAGDPDSFACTAKAGAALASSAPVAPSCPHAQLGGPDPDAACTEPVTASQIDPDDLRCGAGADDLAVALSGLAPSSVSITRLHLVIGAGEDGTDLPIEVAPGPEKSPVVTATAIDKTACASSTSSSSSSGQLFTDLEGPNGSSASSSSGSSNGAPSIESAPSSSSNGSSDDSGSSRGDSCDCDGEAAAAGAEACAEVLGAFAEAAGDDCSMSGKGHRTRGPRFSILLMAALAALVPLRRRARPSRGKRS